MNLKSQVIVQIFREIVNGVNIKKTLPYEFSWRHLLFLLCRVRINFGVKLPPLICTEFSAALSVLSEGVFLPRSITFAFLSLV